MAALPKLRGAFSNGCAPLYLTMKKLLILLLALAFAFVAGRAQPFFFPPPVTTTQWIIILHVGQPPKDFVGPMGYWEPYIGAPRIYFEGPSLLPYDPANPPVPDSMTVVVN